VEARGSVTPNERRNRGERGREKVRRGELGEKVRREKRVVFSISVVRRW
jgi:hypothetical protein